MLDTELLRKTILDRGYKQSVIAQKAGVTPAALSMMLLGRQRMDVDVFLKICAAIREEPETFMHKPEEIA